MTKNNIDTIVVTVNFPEEFTQGTSEAFFNSLARPLRRVLENGIIGRITYVFYKEPDKPSRTFGAFCYTPGERLLFLPGIIKRTLRWNAERNEVRQFNLPEHTLIDHFSLEKELNKWHVTLLHSIKGEKIYPLRTYKTRRYPNNTLFWFALSIKGPRILEPTPQELKLKFNSHQTDSERKIKDIFQVRDGAIFSIVSLPDGITLDEAEYLHFEVLVIEEKRDRIDLPPFANFPTTPPSLQSPVEMSLQLPARIHPARLQGFPGSIFIIVAKHKGILSNDAIITSPIE